MNRTRTRLALVAAGLATAISLTAAAASSAQATACQVPTDLYQITCWAGNSAVVYVFSINKPTLKPGGAVWEFAAIKVDPTTCLVTPDHTMSVGVANCQVLAPIGAASHPGPGQSR